MTTSYKELEKGIYQVSVNDNIVGTVEVDLYGKWEIKPNFAYYTIDTYDIKDKYYSFIEAGRVLTKAWNRYDEDQSLADQYRDYLDDEYFSFD